MITGKAIGLSPDQTADITGRVTGVIAAEVMYGYPAAGDNFFYTL